MQDAAYRDDASRHVSIVRRSVLIWGKIDPSPQRRVLMKEEQRHLALDAAFQTHFSIQRGHIPHEEIRAGLRGGLKLLKDPLYHREILVLKGHLPQSRVTA